MNTLLRAPQCPSIQRDRQKNAQAGFRLRKPRGKDGGPWLRQNQPLSFPCVWPPRRRPAVPAPSAQPAILGKDMGLSRVHGHVRDSKIDGLDTRARFCPQIQSDNRQACPPDTAELRACPGQAQRRLQTSGAATGHRCG